MNNIMSRSFFVIFCLCTISLVLANSYEESREFKGRTLNLLQAFERKNSSIATQSKEELRTRRGGHKLKYFAPFLFGTSRRLSQYSYYYKHIWPWGLLHSHLPIFSYTIFFTGYGGFYTIAALIALKFKLAIIGLFIFGAAFYGFKIWAGKGIGCPEPSIVKEPFYPYVPQLNETRIIKICISGME